jgi:deoxycytidine triphosphate deaminase
MSQGLAAALLDGLRHRAHGLRAYLDALKVESKSVDPRHALAIDLMRDAVQATIALAEQQASAPHADEHAQSLLAPAIGNLRRIHLQADLSFSRGHQTQVSQSLLGAVDREIRDLRLGAPVVAVVTIGPPNNYETFVADLYDELFLDVPVGLRPDKPKERVCLISVPFVEGTRALWQPLVLGHEVAHIALHHEPIRSGLGDVTDWLSDASDVDAGITLPADADEKLQNWVTELLCDLRSVYLFGAAGVAAQADFLHAVGATGRRANYDTHPPVRLRLEFMLEALGAKDSTVLPRELEQIVGPWRPEVLPPAENMGWATTLWRTIDSHRDDIHSLADAMPRHHYDAIARVPTVVMHAKRLEAGIPGRTPTQGRDTRDSWADVLTAGWMARPAVKNLATQDDETPLAVLDDLVGKAVDTLHFTSMWTARRGKIGPPALRSRTSGRQAEAESLVGGTDSLGAAQATRSQEWLGDALRGGAAGALGVLAEDELVRRLRDGIACDPLDQGEALIVTPLFPDATNGAALDVHLAAEFIVFHRSSRSSFNALDDTQDPREMQELVDRGWGKPFILHPGELVLAATLEYLVLPADLTAQVLTRSSYGRLGLLCATAVQVHPHFAGCLTLELVNLGQMPLELRAGERVAQLVFQRVLPAAQTERQTYRFPVGPEFAKFTHSGHLDTLRALARDQSLKRR